MLFLSLLLSSAVGITARLNEYLPILDMDLYQVTHNMETELPKSFTLNIYKESSPYSYI